MSLTGTPSTSSSHGVREPLVVHFGDAVAGAEDHVDELVAVMRLGQPVA